MTRQRRPKRHRARSASGRIRPDAGAQKSAPRERRRGGLLKQALLFGAAVSIAVGIAIVALVIPGRGSEEPSGRPRALIVDQLSLTFPNPDFVREATTTLEQAGFYVDYFAGKDVNVEFYRDLPSVKHDLILLRVHSGLLQDESAILPSLHQRFAEDIRALRDAVFLFTSEPYSVATHQEEQLALSLLPVRYYGTEQGLSRYFAITPEFIEGRMRGGFDGATIVLMGCDGLTFKGTAEAFLRKGAEAVLGWDGPVSARYTDLVTERLLEHLVTGDEPVDQAVAKVMAEEGPDPTYGSNLRVHPPNTLAVAVSGSLLTNPVK
jgi:hypothetical protein